MTAKYSTAAASAMDTIHALARRGARPPAAAPDVCAESALMDKETNAIYWQGGADVFSASVARPYLAGRGVLHVKATVLAAALWLWLWGLASRHLVARYFAGDTRGGRAPPLGSGAPPLLRRAIAIATPVLRFCLLLVHALLHLRLPPYSPVVAAAIVALYLLEVRSCKHVTVMLTSQTRCGM